MKRKSLRVLRVACGVLGCGLSEVALADGPQFVVTFAEGTEALDAFKPQIEEGLIRAGAMWAAEIQAQPVAIDVVVKVGFVPRATGRSVTSAFVGVVAGRNVYQQGAAHELRAGIDPNGTAPDIEIVFNPSYVSGVLWFDPDPSADPPTPIPSNRTEALSVLLHELGHALAYNGWAGGFGDLPATYMSTWDRWTRIAPGSVLFSGPWVVQTWGSEPALTLGNPSHWGNAGNSMMPSAPAAPVAWVGEWRFDSESGVWCPPPQPVLDCAALAGGEVPEDGLAGVERGAALIPQLMNGVVFYHGTRYRIGDLDRAVLRDTGHLVANLPCQWDFNASGSTDTADLVRMLSVFGTCPGDERYFPPADLNPASPCVNTADLVRFLGRFGTECP
jgi:hypothetical protein